MGVYARMVRRSRESDANAGCDSLWAQAAVCGALAMAITALAIFAWISYEQSYMADDYPALLRAQDAEPLEYLLTTYMDWSGRMVPTIVAWLVVPHPGLFAVLNTAVFAGIVLLVFRLGAGRSPQRSVRDALAILLIFAAVWFGAPKADETLVWRVGAMNYSWTLFLALVLLVPFREWYDHRADEPPSRLWRVAQTAALGALGIAVGLSHEQTAVATAWVVAVFLLGVARSRMFRALPVQLYVAAAGLFVGTAAILLSPGPLKRLGLEPQWAIDQRFALFRGFVINTFDVEWSGAYLWLILLVVLGLALSWPTDQGGGLYRRITWALPAMSCMSAAVVVLLPLYRTAWSTSARATFISYGFLLVGIVCLLFDNPGPTVLMNLRIAGVATLAVLTAATLMVDAGMQYRTTVELENWLTWRNSLIYDAAAAGGGDVVVPRIPFPGRRFQYIAEFSDDPDDWYNMAAAQYFGVASIGLEQP